MSDSIAVNSLTSVHINYSNSNADLSAADRVTLPAAVKGAQRPDGLFGSPANVLPTWQGQEAFCLLTGQPDLMRPPLMTILPQWTVDQPGFLFPNRTFYASVRLTDMVDGGCSGAWWDTTANGR